MTLAGIALLALFQAASGPRVEATPGPCPEAPELRCARPAHGARSWAMMPRTTCLEDLTLRGIVKTKAGYRALFESKATEPPRTYTLEPGALLYDAKVVDITGEEVVIHQDGATPSECRTVRRTLKDERRR